MKLHAAIGKIWAAYVIVLGLLTGCHHVAPLTAKDTDTSGWVQVAVVPTASVQKLQNVMIKEGIPAWFDTRYQTNGYPYCPVTVPSESQKRATQILEQRGYKINTEVIFEWFNLSTNEIWVAEVVGLPFEASAGRLRPSHAEDQLKVAASHFSEMVSIKNQIKIVWKDNGARGWPSGSLKSGELVPSGGASHEAEFKRADLGIPAKLTHGKVRFTYLGGDKWRVKLYGLDTTFKGTDSVKDFSPPYIP